MADTGAADNLDEEKKDHEPADENEPGEGTSSRVESKEASEEARNLDAEKESPPEVSAVPATTEPVIDRQLRKAVEYLDRVLSANAKAA